MIKSQSALEYLMIIGLTLGIIVPTTYLFFRYSSETNVEILDAQLNQIGRNIIDTAETVYFSGEGSKIILELNMPKSINDMYIIKNRELVFNLTTEIGDSEAVFFSSANLTSESCTGDICKLTGIAAFGLKRVKIQSVEGGSKVLISKFQG